MKVVDWRQLLDITSNVIVIGTCAVLCSLLAIQASERRRGSRTTPSASADVVPVGSVLKSPSDATFSTTDLTVLVGLSTTCTYCEQSMPAFRQLNERVGSRDAKRVRILALGVQPFEVLAEYLRKNDLSRFTPTTVESMSQLAPLVQRTPSVVIVDRQGRVLATWPGLMTTERLDEVLRHIDAGSPRTPDKK